MAEALSPTSKKDAVNILLASIQEASVNTLTGSLNEDVISAIRKVDQVSRQIQTAGWSFNTEEDFTLSPDLGTGEIRVPKNIVSVDMELSRTDIRPVLRGQRLYDRKNRTFKFSKPVVVKEMVILLPYEELPETARYYIAVKASRLFVDSQLGDPALHQFSAIEEDQALAELNDKELEEQDYGIFDEVELRRVRRKTVL